MSVPERRHLQWPFGSAEVISTAAMLSDMTFLLPSGPFRPFASATWPADGPELQAFPGHIRHLGAEFVCLPFGGGGNASQPAKGWEEALSHPHDQDFHGAAADLDWRFSSVEDERLVLVLDLPEPSPIGRLERRVTGVADRPALDLQLTVHARCACSLPLGLHPILRLPDEPGMLEIEIDFERGIIFPAQGESMDAAVAGALFTSLAAVPGARGPLDFTRLPLPFPAEAVVQLFGAASPVTATFRDEGRGVRISWPDGVLPSLQLWLSDRALISPPWDGQYRGLGLEPTASLFDLGSGASAAGHGLVPGHVATNITFHPDVPVVIDYRLEGFEIFA